MNEDMHEEFQPGRLDMAAYEALFHEHSTDAPVQQWAILWPSTGVVQICRSEADARTLAATMKGVLVQYRWVTSWVPETPAAA